MLDVIRNCGINWGSVADWMMVVATMAAFIVALLLFLATRRQIQMLVAESDQKMAARVVAWVHGIATAERRDSQRAVVGAVATVRLILHNGGEEPVYDLVGKVLLPGYKDGDFHKPMLPPDGKDRQIDLPMETNDPEVATVAYYPNAARVDIRWRDAAERQWHRDADGRLKRVTADRVSS